MPERYRPATHVAWVGRGERVAVLRLDDLDAHPIVLEDSAGEVWRALGEGTSFDDVVIGIAHSYGLASEVVRPGIETFLDEAIASGIVTKDDA